MTTIMSTLHEGRLMYICGNLWLISPLSEKCFRQTLYRKSKKNFLYNDFFFFFFENHDVYEMIWKNTVQPDEPQMTIWRMHNLCWVLHTHIACLFTVRKFLQLLSTFNKQKYWINVCNLVEFLLRAYLMWSRVLCWGNIVSEESSTSIFRVEYKLF